MSLDRTGGPRLSQSIPGWRGQKGSQQTQPQERPSAFQFIFYKEDEIIARQVFTQERVNIGRSPECVLCIDSPMISRFHALVERTERDHYVLKDVGSRNGVWVNGMPISTHHLNDGDLVTLGDLQLEFSPEAWDNFPDHELPKTPAVAVHARVGAPPRGQEQTEIFGRTFNLLPEQTRENKERSSNCRAYVRTISPTSARHRVCQYVLELDVLLLGGGPEADIKLDGWWRPRICAVVVRNEQGFTLEPISVWPFTIRLNERPLRHRVPLEDGDTFSICGQLFSFHLGLPRK